MLYYSEEMKEQIRHEITAGKSQIEVSCKYGVVYYMIRSWHDLRPGTKLRQAPFCTSIQTKQGLLYQSMIRNPDETVLWLARLQPQQKANLVLDRRCAFDVKTWKPI